MKKIISLLLVLALVFCGVYAEGEDSTFLKLIDVNDSFISKLLMGGATAEEIEALVNDMDDFVAGFQENIIMQDIDSFFITILLQTIQQEEHLNVLIAFDSMFQEEMVYMLEERKVPDSMNYFKIILFGDKVTVVAPPEKEDSPVMGEPVEEPEPEPPVIVTPPVEEKISPFSDLSVDSFCFDAVAELNEKGVISGKNDGLFHPDDFIKREEALKMLIKTMLSNENISYSEYIHPGEENLWYAQYLRISRYFSIISGIYDNEYFKPNEYITRQDFVSVAYRTAVRADKFFPLIIPAADFLDISEFRFYAVEPIEKMFRAGIVRGVGENKFAPDGNITRAEAAKIIYDILNVCK